MKTFFTVIGVAVAILGGILFGADLVDKALPLGSVTDDGLYNYTQFTGAIATSTAIKSKSGALGSVVVTEAYAGALVFYDATSTAAVTDGTYLTRVADMKSAITEDTYVFDVALARGLVMVSADGYSFAGDLTVTWK